ncbi:UNVERIFIED_CONTAM: hypothetical protein PYX00_007234 [Menopon gallinae]|uniref:Uncharacterized protein n=1 Tax=Menopon gallinae TaxID=328185 RepID=A0AAW2HII0_9NEOP
MVLGQGVHPVISYGSSDKHSKCGGYQKEIYLNDNKSQKEQKKSQNDKNYGAWGPIYKNRQNFNDMHIC